MLFVVILGQFIFPKWFIGHFRTSKTMAITVSTMLITSPKENITAI